MIPRMTSPQTRMTSQRKVVGTISSALSHRQCPASWFFSAENSSRKRAEYSTDQIAQAISRVLFPHLFRLNNFIMRILHNRSLCSEEKGAGFDHLSATTACAGPVAAGNAVPRPDRRIWNQHSHPALQRVGFTESSRLRESFPPEAELFTFVPTSRDSIVSVALSVSA